MKVSKLIEILEKYDPDLKVCINDCDPIDIDNDCENNIIESVELIEDHFINIFGNEVYGKFICIK